MSWGESTEPGSEEGGLDRAKCRQQRCPREGSGAARVREPGSELTLNIHRLPHAFLPCRPTLRHLACSVLATRVLPVLPLSLRLTT